ncbi:MAG: hypothetical protein IJ491_05685 [Clostridia bacterium]|nr:hypothetical protein [Clostridia bacterium]
MKEGKGQKFSVAVLIIVAVSIVLYMVQSAYFSRTGKIETEYALKSTQKEVLSVEGFAVRDESRIVDGKNTSILYKNSNKVYVPVVSDSVNVAINDVIAVAFENENQADSYLEMRELEEKKSNLTQLQAQKDLSRINVIYLNSQIYSAAQSYAGAIADGDFSALSEAMDEFRENVTSKQIATGESIDFSSMIESYNSKITSLETGLSAMDYVRSPFAGYFVSEVDGYENAKAYDDIVQKKVQSLEAERLINSQSETYENAYGKIIGQHTWYLLFDVSIEDATIIKTGKSVKVDFPERSIYEVPMTVYDVSDLKDGMITVTLKCKYLNERLAVLRKEKLSITIEEYEGFRINSAALLKNEEGIDGVYVLSGSFAKFTPINILYYGDGFVIAEKYVAYTTDKDGNKIIDEKKTASYRELEAYDSIIVKGTNITDGKIIS